MNNIKEKIKSFIDFNKNSEENEFIDDLNYIKLCYEMLKQLGFIETQYQFSEQLLNKSKFYYSMLISEGRKPSIHSMQRLVSNMKELLPLYKKGSKLQFNQLNRLINEGVDVIVLKLI